MKTFFLFLIPSLFMLSSCIDIIDDLTINNDGSGSLKYTINLSSSKLKINSILALDSLDGKRVPDIEEIKVRVASFEKRFEAKAGISNVKIESNYVDFFFRLSCDFTSATALQNALRDVIEEESKEKNIPELNSTWISWDGTKLSRDIPEITVKKTKELKVEDIELLKQGKYTSITRFQRAIEKFDNPAAQLSQNKLAVMLKTNPYSLSQNSKLLENTIYLSPLKN
jgi:arginine repressor